jgi:N-acetylneuraminic acid mutarotase
MATSGYGDYIYALSGNQAHPDGIPDNRFYRYTISTNTWERLADLPFRVGYYVGSRLAYADGHIYAWQGTPSTWTGGGDDLAKRSPTETHDIPTDTRIHKQRPQNRHERHHNHNSTIWKNRHITTLFRYI